jgi:hypothetical protein
VGGKGELIHRLDTFLEQLTRKVGRIDPWSPTRASIIKHAIELWSYLQASKGKFEVITPAIGDIFDPKIHERTNEDDRFDGTQSTRFRWVRRKGSAFQEDCADGNGTRRFQEKALVIVA